MSASISETPVRDNSAADDVKVEKIEYRQDYDIFPVPGDWDSTEDGPYSGPKLTSPEIPSDWDKATHKPLRRGDFKEDHLFLDFKAAEFEQRAAKYREEAEMCRKLGTAADRSKAKKLQTLQSRMAELARELAADGTVDLASILGEDQAKALLGD